MIVGRAGGRDVEWDVVGGADVGGREVRVAVGAAEGDRWVEEEEVRLERDRGERDKLGGRNLGNVDLGSPWDAGIK